MAQTKITNVLVYPVYCSFEWHNLTNRQAGVRGIVMNFPKPLETAEDMTFAKMCFERFMTEEVLQKTKVLCEFSVTMLFLRDLVPFETSVEDFIEPSENESAIEDNKS